MELDDLKSAWQTTPTVVRSADELKALLKESKHPVLKGIRIQLMMEIIGWIAFISLGYTMFDAAQKPIWLNTMVLMTMTLPILHHILGYQLAKKPIVGVNIKLSLSNYLKKLRVYAIWNVILRIVLVSGFVLFFTYGLDLSTRTSFLLIISAIFIVQLMVLAMIWRKRIKRLNDTLLGLD